MNKWVQGLFTVLFPFYPFWAWLSITLVKKPIDFVVTINLIPIVLYLVVYVNKKLPKYLICLIIFTIYHVCSVFINNTIPPNANKFYFLLADPNILACLYFIVIEYTDFEQKYILKMSRYILIVVAISLLVSLIQIKIPTFFFNSNNEDDLFYVGENRNFSIYSWTNLNSAGVTFPILISILINEYNKKKATLPFVMIVAAVFAFLTRARYVMISTLIVLSQFFFNRKSPATKRLSIGLFFIIAVIIIGFSASSFGFDVNEVINNRILEKNTEMESAKSRVLSYDVFMIVYPENPWVGVGPETRKDVVALLGGEAPLIHVGYLSYLYFYGAIGSFFLFLSLFFLLRDAWKVGSRTNFWGTFYGLISFCLANFTFVYFNFSEMGFVLSVIYLRFYKLEPTKPTNSQKEIISVTSPKVLQVSL